MRAIGCSFLVLFFVQMSFAFNEDSIDKSGESCMGNYDETKKKMAALKHHLLCGAGDSLDQCKQLTGIDYATGAAVGLAGVGGLIESMSRSTDRLCSIPGASRFPISLFPKAYARGCDIATTNHYRMMTQNYARSVADDLAGAVVRNGDEIARFAKPATQEYLRVQAVGDVLERMLSKPGEFVDFPETSAYDKRHNPVRRAQWVRKTEALIRQIRNIDPGLDADDYKKLYADFAFEGRKGTYFRAGTRYNELLKNAVTKGSLTGNWYQRLSNIKNLNVYQLRRLQNELFQSRKALPGLEGLQRMITERVSLMSDRMLYSDTARYLAKTRDIPLDKLDEIARSMGAPRPQSSNGNRLRGNFDAMRMSRPNQLNNPAYWDADNKGPIKQTFDSSKRISLSRTAMIGARAFASGGAKALGIALRGITGTAGTAITLGAMAEEIGCDGAFNQYYTVIKNDGGNCQPQVAFNEPAVDFVTNLNEYDHWAFLQESPDLCGVMNSLLDEIGPGRWKGQCTDTGFQLKDREPGKRHSITVETSEDGSLKQLKNLNMSGNMHYVVDYTTTNDGDNFPTIYRELEPLEKESSKHYMGFSSDPKWGKFREVDDLPLQDISLEDRFLRGISDQAEDRMSFRSNNFLVLEAQACCNGSESISEERCKAYGFDAPKIRRPAGASGNAGSAR